MWAGSLSAVYTVVTGKVLGQVQTGSVIQYIPADQLGEGRSLGSFIAMALSLYVCLATPHSP